MGLGWFAGGVCTSQARLDGKTVVVTGGNTGIGKETAIDMAKRGARVIIACRSKERGEAATESICAESGSADVHLRILDLTSFTSIRKFSSELTAEESQVNILINNAGVMMCPLSRTEDGIEMQIGTNHVGHFLLTNLLLDKIKQSAPSRIVNVSSRAHLRGSINFDDINSEKSYSEIHAYSQSKLANILFTRALHERVQGTGVTTYSLHPGVIKTELGRHHPWAFSFLMGLGGFMCKTPVQGAQTSIYCAVQEGIEHLSGRYFGDCAELTTSKAGQDMGVAERLWNLTAEWCGLSNAATTAEAEAVAEDKSKL